MVDPAILLSELMSDLPPKDLRPDALTLDQAREFLYIKEYWTEIYSALTRLNMGLPLENPNFYNDKPLQEKMKAEIDYWLTLYQLVDVAWLEIKILFNPAQTEKFKTPGELFLSLLSLHSFTMFAPCLAKKFSHRVRDIYKKIPDLLAGEDVNIETTPLIEWAMRLERMVLAICGNSNDAKVKKAFKAHRETIAEQIRLARKHFNPKQKLLGGQWTEGFYTEGKKGVRYTPNAEDYR